MSVVNNNGSSSTGNMIFGLPYVNKKKQRLILNAKLEYIPTSHFHGVADDSHGILFVKCYTSIYLNQYEWYRELNKTEKDRIYNIIFDMIDKNSGVLMNEILAQTGQMMDVYKGNKKQDTFLQFLCRYMKDSEYERVFDQWMKKRLSKRSKDARNTLKAALEYNPSIYENYKSKTQPTHTISAKANAKTQSKLISYLNQ